MKAFKKQINRDKPIIFFIFLYAVFSPVSLAGANTAVALALICWGAKSVIEKKVRFRECPLNVPLLIFVAVAGLSVLVSTDFKWSLERYDSFWMAGIFFLAANNITGKAQLKKVMVFLIVFTVVIALIGIVEHFIKANVQNNEFFIGGWQEEPILRSMGLSSHPVKFGMYLAMVLPLALGSIFYSKKWKSRLGYIVSFIILLLALLYSYSRGCWIAVLFASVFFGLLNLKLKKSIAVVSAGLTVIVLLVLLFPGSSVSKRVKTVFNVKYDGSTMERLASWKRSMVMIKEKPVLGFGWSRIGVENRKYVKDNEKPFNHAHNMYLNFFVETGLAGLGVLLWLFVIIIVSGFYILKRVDDRFLRITCCGILSSIVAFMVIGVVDYPFNIPVITELFYFLTGALFAIPGIEGSSLN